MTKPTLTMTDAVLKVEGAARYTADLSLPGMVHARPVLSPFPAAAITSIDVSAAERFPGVVAVFTAENLPTAGLPARDRNSAILATDRVVWQGQPVALVVADSEAAAADASRLVDVGYEPRPAVVDLAEAQAADGPLVWPEGIAHGAGAAAEAHAGGVAAEGEIAGRNIESSIDFTRGDVAAAMASAEATVSLRLQTSTVHQGYLEPHAVVASIDPVDDTLTLYTSTQGVLSTRNGTARLLGLDRDKVRVVPMTVGGGFGAKYGIFEPLAGAAAIALRRPVKLVLTRSEDFGTTTPAPGLESSIEVAAAADGTLTAIRADIAVESGSFSSGMAGIVANLVGSAYRCDNLDITAREILVNKAMMGAYRAPGSPQAFYILESAIDELARKLDVDPLEFRLANAAVTGDPMADDKRWPSIGTTNCLEAVRDHPLWKGRHDLPPNRGIGLAIGGFPGGTHPAAALCRADADGTFYVHVGSVDLTGTNSAMALITAEIIGISPEDVKVVQGDSSTNPVSGPAGGSMTTYTVGAAVAEAARGARTQILELASQMLEAAVEDLEIEDGIVKVKGSPGAEIPVKKIASSTVRFGGRYAPITAQGRSAITTQAPGFTAQLVEVEVDPDTGKLTVLNNVVFQDVGRALNPPLIEAQIHGGAAQGLSWAFLEEMAFDESGSLAAGNLSSYLLPEATQVPVIEAVMLENPAPDGPLGARGVGEPPITAGPAAVANAVRDAIGVRVSQLPLTPERIWRAIQSVGAPSET